MTSELFLSIFLAALVAAYTRVPSRHLPAKERNFHKRRRQTRKFVLGLKGCGP